MPSGEQGIAPNLICSRVRLQWLLLHHVQLLMSVDTISDHVVFTEWLSSELELMICGRQTLRELVISRNWKWLAVYSFLSRGTPQTAAEVLTLAVKPHRGCLINASCHPGNYESWTSLPVICQSQEYKYFIFSKLCGIKTAHNFFWHVSKLNDVIWTSARPEGLQFLLNCSLYFINE